MLHIVVAVLLVLGVAVVRTLQSRAARPQPAPDAAAPGYVIGLSVWSRGEEEGGWSTFCRTAGTASGSSLLTLSVDALFLHACLSLPLSLYLSLSLSLCLSIRLLMCAFVLNARSVAQRR